MFNFYSLKQFYLYILRTHLEAPENHENAKRIIAFIPTVKKRKIDESPASIEIQ